MFVTALFVAMGRCASYGSYRCCVVCVVRVVAVRVVCVVLWFGGVVVWWFGGGNVVWWYGVVGWCGGLVVGVVLVSPFPFSRRGDVGYGSLRGVVWP